MHLYPPSRATHAATPTVHMPTFVPLRRRRRRPSIWPRLMVGGVVAAFCGVIVAYAALERHQQKGLARGLSSAPTPTASFDLELAIQADRARTRTR